MSNINFINVDLDVVSKQSLDALVADFGDKVFVLRNGPTEEDGFIVTFEISDSDSGADAIINGFCTLIENLSEEASTLWQSSLSRTFDIGFSTGVEPPTHRTIVHPQTIRRMADLNASLAMTIYPPYPDDIT